MNEEKGQHISRTAATWHRQSLPTVVLWGSTNNIVKHLWMLVKCWINESYWAFANPNAFLYLYIHESSTNGMGQIGCTPSGRTILLIMAATNGVDRLVPPFKLQFSCLQILMPQRATFFPSKQVSFEALETSYCALLAEISG